MKIENCNHIKSSIIALTGITFSFMSCANSNPPAGAQAQQQESVVYSKIELSEACVSEILDISETKENFDLQGFINNLQNEVAKINDSAKNPFGKQELDSKVTSAGITVGCVREFPTNPEEIQNLLTRDIVPKLQKAKNSSDM